MVRGRTMNLKRHALGRVGLVDRMVALEGGAVISDEQRAPAAQRRLA